jgi:microcystin-dependent protein
MGKKTIPELDELEVSDENSYLPIDDGIQTYKQKVDNLFKSAQQLLRFTSTERDAIVSPLEGLEIYNETQKCKQVYTGSGWSNIGPQTGEIISAGVSTAPAGFLACDGSSLLRTDYADLFAAIGTTFGAADGTHFNVPDTRRRALVGKGGTGTGTLAATVGSTGGEEEHTLTTAETPAHTHTVSGTTGATTPQIYTDFGSGIGPADGGVAYGDSNHSQAYAFQASHTHSFSATSSSVGSGSAHNNIQPSLVVGHFIKY